MKENLFFRILISQFAASLAVASVPRISPSENSFLGKPDAASVAATFPLASASATNALCC